jgi:signal transduction histidine kinase
MSVHPDGYALLKATIELSASSLPIETKMEKILQCITDGFESDRSLHLRPEAVLKDGFLSRVAERRKLLWVDEATPFQEEALLPEEKDLLCPSFACIPLFDEISFQGIFYIGFSKSRTFSSSDLEVLLLLSKEIGAAIRNDQLHRVAEDHVRRVRQLSTLWELNKALLTTVNFDRIIHMTLTAITIGDGLGFNRAMLFLVNDRGRALEGTMAVGPNSAEEAERIWSALSQRKGNPSELIVQIESSTENHSNLNSLVKAIEVPLEHEQCILSRTVLEGRPFNIRLPFCGEEWVQTRCERGCALSSEVGCYVSEHLSQNPRIYAFATIPLWGKGKVIGVILVDNLYNRNPITEDDIRYLTTFSNQAGLAIENARLYRNLEGVHQELKEAQTLLVYQEKMAALGELSASIAHEIRNPLVSIGGFARRLDRTLFADAPEKRYTQTIMKEVQRLEKILGNILTYTHEEPVALKKLDLREVMEESLSMMSEGLRNGGIQLTKKFSEKVPEVTGDYYQLKQAFFNLISNAYESMNGKGRLSIRIHPLSMNGTSFVKVEVEDTGAGIDPEALHHIFNPFYTTKDDRLGLGLPIIHKIVTVHQGQIEVNNHPGRGVIFSLTFPAQEEKQR